jgi:hypothetical protein
VKAVRRKEKVKRKAKSGLARKLPLWLRRLDRVKAELKGTLFPFTSEALRKRQKNLAEAMAGARN